MKRLIVALLVGTAGTAAVQAADPIVPVAPAPVYSPEVSVYDWDGFYAGIHGGAQFSGNTHYVIGGFAGYNVVDGSMVYGVEAQADYVANDDFEAGEYAVLGRVGTLVGPDTLVYGAAGFNYRDTSASIDGWGYSFGGGVEHAVTDSIAVRGEVLGQGTFDYDDGTPYAAKATAGFVFSF